MAQIICPQECSNCSRRFINDEKAYLIRSVTMKLKEPVERRNPYKRYKVAPGNVYPDFRGKINKVLCIDCYRE